MAAKLLQSSLLCSDINLKSLIGLSLDDADHLLITCKFVIKRYNIHDRKQVNSWITQQWYPFSTAAVRDPISQKIVCVLNKKFICHWKLEENQIEEKKTAMKMAIHKLLVYNDIVYIVYEHGYVESIENALKTRKQLKKQLLPVSNSQPDDILQASIIDNNGIPLVVLITKNKDDQTLLYTYNIDSDIITSTLHLKLNNHSLMGLCIDSSKLLSFWSDGNLYSMNIVAPHTSSNPGTRQGRFNFLKSTKKVQICQLPPCHIAIVGMDINEEGGMIALWDTKFGVKVCTKPMKMYIDPPLAWSFPSGIVAVDGGALVHIPVILTPVTSASQFGCRQSDIPELTASERNALEGQDILSAYVSQELSKVIFKIGFPSQSTDTILSNVVKYLIENNNTALLKECLSAFGTIPKHCLVAILIYFMQLNGSTNEDQVLNAEIEPLVNAVLTHSLCIQEDFLDELRKLNFDYSWLLLNYLHKLLSSGNTTLVEDESKVKPSLEQVCKWLCLLIDVNYHKLVLTSESKYHQKLQLLLKEVAEVGEYLESLEPLGALADSVMFNQEMPASQANATYSIEWIDI